MLVCDQICYPSPDLRYVFAPGDRAKKSRNLIPLTRLFFPMNVQEWQHQHTVISFPLCQNDNSKDKMPFILYFLFSVIQFWEMRHKSPKTKPKLCNVTHAMSKIKILSLCGRCVIRTIFFLAQPNPNCRH